MKPDLTSNILYHFFLFQYEFYHMIPQPIKNCFTYGILYLSTSKRNFNIFQLVRAIFSFA